MPVQYRPELHVTAETGVLNAPAGVVRDGSTWHVFYQFQPKVDAPPRWGHVVADDAPFFFSECDDALAPTGGEIAVRAGSVLPNGQGADLYFTSVTSAGTAVELARIDELESSCSVSDEPSTIDSSCRRLSTVVSDHEGWTNFRSPCVVRGWSEVDNREAGHEGWLMLAVTGEVEDPTPVILTSPDSRDWTVVGPLTFEGEHGLSSTTYMVAPRLLRLRDEVDGVIYDVLLLTLERDGADISGYLVGQLHGSTFSVTTGFTQIDHGYDFTRPRNVYYSPGTLPDEQRLDQAVIFGLLNRAGRADQPAEHLSLKESDWANVLSLPRVLTLQGGLIYQTPFAGLPEAISQSTRARGWVGLCEIPAESMVEVEVRDEDDRVCFTVCHAGSSLTIDRSMNPYHDAGDKPTSVSLREDDSDTLSIFVDGSVVEVFADGGQVAMASRVYIKGSPKFTVTTTGDAHVERAYEHTPGSTGI